MPLKISSTPDGSLRLAGRFDAAEVETAKKVLWELQGPTRIDLADLEYISSAGIGIIVEAFSRLKAGGHTMTLTNLNRSVRSVFSLTGLDRVLLIE